MLSGCSSSCRKKWKLHYPMYSSQLWLLYCFLVWMMTDLSRGYERILFAAKFSHPSRYAGYPLWPLAPHLPMGMWCIPFIATWCCTLKTAWWCPRSSLSNGWKSIRDKVRKLARHFVPAQWTVSSGHGLRYCVATANVTAHFPFSLIAALSGAWCCMIESHSISVLGGLSIKRTAWDLKLVQ